MATQSNTRFHCDESLGSLINRHAVSFQSGAVNAISDMIPLGTYHGTSTSVSNFVFQANSSMNMTSISPHGFPQSGNSSSSSLYFDSVSGLKQDTASPADWSAEEQRRLEEGLDKFKNEPSIMKYIKIAATLRDKTVRDVALRCRWMTRKRRKAEEYNTGKKYTIGKDKHVEFSSKVSISSVPPPNLAAYPLLVHQAGANEQIQYEGLSDDIIHLLEQNTQAFSQITANISVYKLHENINLLCKTRNNITAILNAMSNMPGMMSQMPPLPVSINEDLVNSILPDMTPSVVLGVAGGVRLKQEPRT